MPTCKTPSIACLTILFFLCLANSFAFDPPQPILKLNPYLAPNMADIEGAVTTTGKYIFPSNEDAAVGREPYVYDLNAGTVALLQDLAPGVNGSNCRNFIPFGDRVLFLASSPSTGDELWSTDGTSVGTVIAADINPGTSGSSPDNLTPVQIGGVYKAYLSATTAANGNEIWFYNGVTATLAADIAVGTDSSYPGNLQSLNSGSLGFWANTAATGVEPYFCNFGGACSSMGDINPGAGSSYPNNFYVNMNSSRVYFTADNGTTGIEPYFTPGGAATLVGDINTGAGSSFSGCFFSDSLTTTTYFLGFDSNTDPNLYSHNNLAVLNTVGPITPFPYITSDNCSPITTDNVTEKLIFVTYHDDYGQEFWVSDGTIPGTTLLKDIAPGSFSSAPDIFQRIGTGAAQRLVFAASTDTAGKELWTTDGSTAGTSLLADVIPGVPGSSPVFFGAGQNHLVSVSHSSISPSTILSVVKTDGTPAGTSVVGPFPKNNFAGSSMLEKFLGVAGNKYIAKMDDGTRGLELGASDGTSAGTGIIADIVPGPFSSNITGEKKFGNKLIFSAVGPSSSADSEPWITDGTAAGTFRLGDLETGPNGSNPHFFGELNGKYYFSAYLTNQASRLFETDGTIAGTKQVFDPNTSSNLATSSNGVVAGSKIFYSGYVDNNSGFELISSDATVAGTVLVKDIRTGISPSNISFLTALGSKVFFLADDGSTGSEPWISDGTGAGTFLLKDIQNGAQGSSIFVAPTLAGDLLYFLANDGINGTELWRTDGTSAGTIRLTDLNPGAGNSSIDGLVAFKNKLFFAGNTAQNGTELWNSDGTIAGTTLFSDLVPGVNSSNPRYFAELVGNLFFAAFDSANGTEVHYIDSTLSGIKLAADLNPGDGSSYPFGLGAAYGSLYFTATPVTAEGNKLFKIEVDKCPADDNKLVPGVCGCGNADADGDGDGVLNCLDQCPTDGTKVVVGACGCGIADTDANGNAQADCLDPNPAVAPNAPLVKLNKKKPGQVIVTMQKASGVKYFLVFEQKVPGKKKKFKRVKVTSDTELVTRKLKFKGKVSVYYQFLIGTQTSINSLVKKIKL